MAAIIFVACSFQSNKKQMNTIKIIYVYDAICGWCFGFSPTVQRLKEVYSGKVEFEIISGGLKLGRGAGPIDVIAPYIKTSYQDVERATGVKFSDNFINGTLREGTMILNSLPPAIALSIIKERYPDKAFAFASLLHKMYYVDGIEPEDYDAYGGYAATIGYEKDEFNTRMGDDKYIKKAEMEFQYAKALGVNSYPTMIMEKNGKREILFNGFLPFEHAKKLIDGKLIR